MPNATETSEAPNNERPHDDESTRLVETATVFDRWMVRIGGVFAWIFLAAVLITAYEVIMRYVFNSPTEWVHETTVFLVSLGFTFSCAYALALGTHIRITVVSELLPPRIKGVLEKLNLAILTVYFGVAAYAAYLLARPAVLNYESTGTAWDPHFPPYDKGFLVLMMIVFGVQTLLQLIRSFGRRS